MIFSLKMRYFKEHLKWLKHCPYTKYQKIIKNRNITANSYSHSEKIVITEEINC